MIRFRSSTAFSFLRLSYRTLQLLFSNPPSSVLPSSLSYVRITQHRVVQNEGVVLERLYCAYGFHEFLFCNFIDDNILKCRFEVSTEVCFLEGLQHVLPIFLYEGMNTASWLMISFDVVGVEFSTLISLTAFLNLRSSDISLEAKKGVWFPILLFFLYLLIK